MIENANKMVAFLFLVLLLSGCATQSTQETQAMYPRITQHYKKGQYSRVITELTALARRGDPKAQYGLGYMYYYGKGVKQNKLLGKQWICRAETAGYHPAVIACRQLAGITSFSQNTPDNQFHQQRTA